jgi:hypothetical protein
LVEVARAALIPLPAAAFFGGVPAPVLVFDTAFAFATFVRVEVFFEAFFFETLLLPAFLPGLLTAFFFEAAFFLVALLAGFFAAFFAAFFAVFLAAFVAAPFVADFLVFFLLGTRAPEAFRVALPADFFALVFLAAAFFFGIRDASKTLSNKSAIIHTLLGSGSLFVAVLGGFFADRKTRPRD